MFFMICIVSRTNGRGSGAEMVLNYLLDSFEKKNELIVITAKESSVSSNAKKNKIKVIEIEFVANQYLINIYHILKAISKLGNIQLVHAWQAKSFEISFFISLIKRVPLTCTIHDHPNTNIYTKKKKRIIKFVSNYALSSICVSNALKNECIINGFRNNLLVINNGLPAFENITYRFHQSKKNICIGFLGMYANWKGFDVVSRWILNYQREDIEWHLFGDITIKNKIILEKITENITSNVFYHGYQEVDFIFKNIDILVAPSTQFDPFPTILLEAARAGIPAIASNCGGAAEIIKHYETGFLFDIQNEANGLEFLKNLLNDRSLIKKMNLNAIKHFESEFIITKTTSKYAELWKI